jgi:hypothetical protein
MSRVTLLTSTVTACAIGAGMYLASLGTAAPAAAWGERCHEPIAADGRWKSSWRSAKYDAMRAWQVAAHKRFGRAYADWWYSGDRVIHCQWNAKGHYQCTGVARACGPR